MSFFHNPFSSQVGQRIERATSEQLDNEDWALNMEICDIINETDDGPKDAIRALRKRLFGNRIYKQVLLALSVLETCVKNCGKRFHVRVAEKEFVAEFGKLASPRANVPTIVQHKVLGLVQNWADAFRGQADMVTIHALYQNFRQQGVEFPAQDLDTLAPIYTPNRSVAEQQQPSQSPATLQHSPSAPRRGQHDWQQQQLAPQWQRQPVPQWQQQAVPQWQQAPPEESPPGLLPNELSGPASITPTADQIAKVRSEIDVVSGNVGVLSDMMTNLRPGEENPSDWELLRDLNTTCRTMQTRLVDLLSRIVSEELTGELLRINDDLNNTFVRYDRYEKNRTAVLQGTRVATGQPTPITSVSTVPDSDSSSVTPLIDLGDNGPAPTSSSAAAASMYNELPQDLAGIVDLDGVGVGVGETPNFLPGGLTQPAESAPASATQVDEFDMFAQSRQSFDQANQERQNRALGYNVEDTHQSVAGAINARNPFAVPEQSQQDANRMQGMEQWLAATDLSHQPPSYENTQESMTTAEFDKFLEERATKVSGEPNVLSSQSRRARPQMQQEGTHQEEELFGL